MNHGKTIVTAVLVSGGLTLGVQACSSTRHYSESREARAMTPAALNVTTQDVKHAEEALMKKGYNPGPVDGVTDDQFRQAMMSFQRAHRLAVTGTLDEKSAKELGIKLSSESSYPPSITRTKPESPLNSGSRPGTGLRQ